MGRRDRFNVFIERHEVAWELAMGALALIWVAVGFLIDEHGVIVRDVAMGPEAIVGLAENGPWVGARKELENGRAVR